MEKHQRKGGHIVSRLTVHIVWVTKYRYHALKGDIQVRCRDLIKQICDAEDVRILKGVISKGHVHLHMEYAPKVSISDFVKRLNGRTSRKLQQEYPELGKRYCGRHFWTIGYGAWSIGNITEIKMILMMMMRLFWNRRLSVAIQTYGLVVHSGLVFPKIIFSP